MELPNLLYPYWLVPALTGHGKLPAVTFKILHGTTKHIGCLPTLATHGKLPAVTPNILYGTTKHNGWYQLYPVMVNFWL